MTSAVSILVLSSNIACKKVFPEALAQEPTGEVQGTTVKTLTPAQEALVAKCDAALTVGSGRRDEDRQDCGVLLGMAGADNPREAVETISGDRGVTMGFLHDYSLMLPFQNLERVTIENSDLNGPANFAKLAGLSKLKLLVVYSNPRDADVFTWPCPVNPVKVKGARCEIPRPAPLP